MVERARAGENNCRMLGFVGRGDALRKRAHACVSHTPQREIDFLQRTRRPPVLQELDRFGHQEPDQRDERTGYETAEHEHRPPVERHEQQRCDRAADDRTGGIAARHERYREVAAFRVGILRRHRVDRGQHPADAEPGRETVNEHRQDGVRRRREEHAAGHRNEAGEDRRSPPESVGRAAQQYGTERHADQFRRENDTERRPVHAPFGRNSGRREADRQHVEAVECVQAYAQSHRDDLQPAHRRVQQDLSWIFVHASAFPLRDHSNKFSATQ